jgi:hypothetical protein
MQSFRMTGEMFFIILAKFVVCCVHSWGSKFAPRGETKNWPLSQERSNMYRFNRPRVFTAGVDFMKPFWSKFTDKANNLVNFRFVIMT